MRGTQILLQTEMVVKLPVGERLDTVLGRQYHGINQDIDQACARSVVAIGGPGSLAGFQPLCWGLVQW